MSRARVIALALVNWKGVFYERYLFDRHVTALEGANGAGKTTVMIAAYVVLLPDLTRLRFTNLGEGSATGGDRGIWGRLGEAGRPSYAALEIEVGDRSFVCGVHLERKSEPTLTLTPFLVEGLAPRGRLKELLLLDAGDHDEVPELAELRANVARLGGGVEVFPTVKEYFGALFERGITPLRLSTDEERNKLNEMLRTSMTGGISRALTSDLRSFLLKEESGLSDTLARMRANLDACHRTRTEVGEARLLEHEISGVYDAGQAMFSAAVQATRERDRESAARLERAREAHEGAAKALAELDGAVERTKEAHARSAERAAAVKGRAREAEARRSKLTAARALGRRVTELAAELARAELVARDALAAHDAATRARDARRAERDRARDGYDRAATGVGDLEKGLEELHRNAHAHRRVLRRLDEAREATGDPALGETTVAAALDGARTRLVEIDRARSRIDRELESALARREEHARAVDALRALAAADAGEDTSTPLHERARTLLARFADREAMLGREADLPAEISRARRLAERQAQARARARELAVGELASDDPAADVQRLASAVDAELTALDEEARALEAKALEARRARDALTAERRALEVRADAWALHGSKLEALERRRGRSLREPQSIAAARKHIAQEAESERRALEAIEARRESAVREANALEASGSAFDPELGLLCDELDAEMLAGRFEDVEPQEAALLQARLGPLREALIVDDPRAAAAALSKLPRTAASVLLVSSSAPLDATPVLERRGDDVLVEEPFGLRVTRVPEQPSLGRRARERRVATLRRDAEEGAAAIELSMARLRGLETAERDADAVLTAWSAIAGGDPGEALERAAERDAVLVHDEASHQAMAGDARARMARLRERAAGLRRLLEDAYLLGAIDRAAHVAELEARAGDLERAREELAAAAPHRATLAELLDALRAPPLSDGERDARAREREALAIERDRVFAVISLLTEIDESRHAFGYADAERALGERTALAPALEEQRARARAAWEAEEAQLRQAEADWERTANARQRADAERGAVAAHARRAADELADAGLTDVSEDAERDAERALGELEAELAATEEEERRLATEIALLGERRGVSSRAARAAADAFEAASRDAAPARDAWSALSRAADAANVLKKALGARTAEARESADRWPEARSKGELLLDRLRASRGNAESAERVHRLLAAAAEATPSGEAGARYLEVWLTVRDALRRCLPAQVADVDDPLEALIRLRDDLALLEERLRRQETELRGASEDVARGIDVRLRRAKSQVRRLNQSLTGIRFGNVAAIRVDLRRVERMEKILGALREGEVQELLFRANLPIEEALDEIFRRYGGGGRAGGQRILDYREYVDLGVAIQRAAGKDGAEPAWEPASPTRLSTGEAIGVGAALMMVVLTEWERDANLLQPRRAVGSLRFLFLDEANRLSQDNLGVLFDLCRNLDLQLLIAAPEVARATGNTTYRLVRRVDEAGREEVVVSGRRVHPDAPDYQKETIGTPDSDDTVDATGSAIITGSADG